MLNTFSGEKLYPILKPLAKAIFYRKFNVVEGDYVLPDYEPYILVGHHVSAFDPIIINCFSKRLIYFLYGDVNKDLKLRQFLLNRLEMIPFSKKTADFRSIREVKKKLKAKKPVGIYPEGSATWDGRTQPIIVSTAKLIKMMNVPVYGVRYYGAYLSKPRWCKYTRKGQVKMETFLVISADDIHVLSTEQIEKRLISSIQYDEMMWQKEAMVPFNGKRRAENIERFLYACPECGAFNSFTSHKHEFSCNSCDTRFFYSEYGFIKKKGQDYCMQISEWSRWQYKTLDTVEGFPQIRQIETYIDGVPYIEPISLSKSGINIQSNIPFHEIRSLSMTLSTHLEFFYQGKKYRLVFKEGATISIKFFHDYIERHQKN